MPALRTGAGSTGRRRLPVLVLLAASAVLAASTAPAAASTLNPCSQPVSQPFLPWLDPGWYTLVPGGDLESGAAGWALSGGAAVVSGNEPYDVTASGDSRSLTLPAGSSATSPGVCVGLLSPTTRLFVRNSGSPLGALRVDIVYQGLLGLRLTAPIALVTAGSAWQPTLPIPLLANLTVPPLVTAGTTAVAFRFTPVGAGAAFQIDDDYVDPYQGR